MESGAAVDVVGASKRFGDLEAVADISLAIGSGEIVTILGPSGCGKTTLLRMIAGLEHPTTGTFSVNGAPPQLARNRKAIGLVPQSPALLPWRSVRANASLLLDINAAANPATTPDVDALLTDVGLADFGDAYPHELSGGMRQRVGLVRAFALGAPLLLMDEPFAALDEITRADMRHMLARLTAPSRATVVFVTHSIAEAVFLSDRVAVMSHRPGRIAGEIGIDLTRPRLADVEDTPDFFAHETELRSLLREVSRT